VDALQSAGQEFHIFHFIGHGIFAKGGSLVLERADQRGESFPADKLALTLRSLGVRLAVLGACETARRDSMNAWNGVAPALMKVGIGAALANQYAVLDQTAIAFTRRFYAALAAGLALDEAVSLGRLAILNVNAADNSAWGVPVLYMHAADGILFPDISSDPTRAAARQALHLEIQQRIELLRGSLIGVRANAIHSGRINVQQEIAEVGSSGAASGVEAKTIGGGELQVEQTIKHVDEGGSVTGVSLDDLP
jgi:hypothetical protein